MIASKWFDMIVGVDIHVVMVPTPAGPVPTPLPHPFTGVIYDPAGLLVGMAISGAISVIADAPFAGPVFVNSMPIGNTGTEGTNKMVMPHIPTPPGVSWAPVPAAPMPPDPDGSPNPPTPTPAPSNDGMIITGSKTVFMSGTNATRLGDMVLTCAEPVRLPSSAVIAVPLGAPVMVGGPPAIDFLAAIMGLVRSKWVTGKIRRLIGATDGSWRSKLICMLTGHPVDVASGMMLTDAVDFALPGPIPFRFARDYTSRSRRRGSLGFGWSHAYEESVVFESDRIVQCAGDGRELYFEAVEPGHATRNRSESLTLHREAASIRIDDRDGLTRVFAPAGRADGSWPLVRIENLRGQQIQFRYDVAGRLVEAVDSVGRVIGFENDAQGRIVAITLPHPDQEGARFRVVRFTYDEAGDLVAATDPLEHAQRYGYKHHLMVQETDRNGFSFYFSYDGIGPGARCVRTWGDGGLYDHLLQYDPAKRITVKEDSNGARTTYFANEAGLIDRVIDSLGREQSFAYDEALRTVLVTQGDGSEIQLEYDEAGNITKVTDGDGLATSYEYDERDRETAQVDGEGNVYAHSYTSWGEILESINPAGNGFRHDYSETGQLQSIVSRSGRRAEFAWDEQWNLTAFSVPGEDDVRFRSDQLGSPAEIEIEDGGRIRFERDLLGRPRRIHHTILGSMQFEYDGEGNVLRSVDDAGNWRAFQYGQFDKLLSVEDSALGRRSFEYGNEGDLLAITNENGERYQMQVDSEGQVTAVTDFCGRQTKYRHDAAGRLSEVTEPGGRTRTLTWTPAGRLAAVEYADGCFEKFTYDANGREIAIENETGVLERSYDTIGRLSGESFDGFSVEYGYEQDDLRTELRASDGTGIRYGYDLASNLTRLEVEGGPRFEREYDARGRPVRSFLPGGVSERLSYDELGFPFEQRIDSSDGLLLSGRQYQFNAGGALCGLFDRKRGKTAYAVGAKGLERVLRDGQVAEEYTYDAAGYRSVAGCENEIAPGGALQRQGGIRYVYDEDGRVVRKDSPGGTTEFEYNARGQLVHSVGSDGEEVRYAYDPIGRRVSKRVGDTETRWAWADQELLREETRRGTRSEITHYFFEPNSFNPIGTTRGGRSFGFVLDPIGTPQEVVGDDGRVAWAGDYEAFGGLRRTLSRGYDNRLRLPGQYCDAETGLHYNRHRYYDPETGRFLTPDPTGIGGGLDVYGYPTNPTSYVDPLGLSCEPRLGVRGYLRSFMVFFRSGIRPKHARAIMRVAMREGTELTFRKIRWSKRLGAMIAGMLGVPPKPLTVKPKAGLVTGTVTDAEGRVFRSDYDPTYYARGSGADRRVLSNDEALDMNRKINNEIGGDEIQHGTHNTMDEAGVPPDKVADIGPPGDSIRFNPDGTTSNVSNSDMIGDPDVPWLW